MARAKDKRAQRLAEETQRILNESRKDLRQLDLSEKEARRNICWFLNHLSQFDDAIPDQQVPENGPHESSPR